MTSFYIHTQGCSHNFADSEQMAGLLVAARFELAKSMDEADIVIFNTCTVKGPTERAFFRELERLRRDFPYKAIVIAGCIPQSEPELLKDVCLLGTRQIHRIVEVVEEAINDNVVRALGTGEMPPLDLPKVRKNPVVEIIPINRGCLSRCTFCKTKAARGNLESYPKEDIVALARKAIKEGVREIWLTSQDTGCYGFDIGTNLAELTKEIIAIPGDFTLRLGMMNPVHLPRIKDELFTLFNHEKVFSFLHLPAQSGSNAVLKAMLRGNTRELYLDLVEEFRRVCPQATLATDIIVGFPGESDDDFWQTLELLRVTAPEVVNLSKFWPRPNTPAAEMEQVAGEIIKKRSGIVSDIAQNISSIANERWLGWKGSIVLYEKGKHEGQWIGHNFAYKQVIVEGDFTLGEKLQIEVTKATTYGLFAKVLAD